MASSAYPMMRHYPRPAVRCLPAVPPTTLTTTTRSRCTRTTLARFLHPDTADTTAAGGAVPPLPPGTKPEKNLGGAEQKFYINLALLLPLINMD